MRDHRIGIIEKRLKGLKRILLFTGAKGGVGKSTCTAVSALVLAKRGYACGVLDLDFQGSSIHLLLGMEPGLPDEDRGILPRTAAPGVSLMSMSFFTGERGVPLRGEHTTEAIKELLAVTQWPDTDVLLIDMPPGMGDEILDILRFIPRSEPLVVLTPSVLSVKVASRFAQYMKDSGVSAKGVIVNMAAETSDFRQLLASEPALAALPLLGIIPLCAGLDKNTGSPDGLLQSTVAGSLDAILSAVIKPESALNLKNL